MSIAVKVSGVTKSYRDGSGGRVVDVLRGVDLDVIEGEMVGIVGPSGSGKSTLLHCLGALDHYDSGTIEIGGVELRLRTARDRARFRNRTIGFVFQFHRLLAEFNALENVTLPGRIAGMRSADLDRRARSLLSEVGLEQRLEHFPNQLSGGERQRVAICRALLLNPPLLLADEPTGNLDPESADQILEQLIELQGRYGTTMVLVTHNPVLAGRCGRILELRDGLLRDHVSRPLAAKADQ